MPLVWNGPFLPNKRRLSPLFDDWISPRIVQIDSIPWLNLSQIMFSLSLPKKASQEPHTWKSRVDISSGVKVVTFKQELCKPQIFWQTQLKLFETKLRVCFPLQLSGRTRAATGLGAIHITSDKGYSRCRKSQQQHRTLHEFILNQQQCHCRFFSVRSYLQFHAMVI